MEHSFNTDVAKDVGLLSAVLLNNINFWVQKNKANRKHFYDDYYWTYNSVKAFAELFPYVTERQIRTALIKLEEKGYIITGNYNQIGYDHTKWYAVSHKAESVLTNMSNQKDENVKPIPDIKTDIIYENNKELMEYLVSEWNEIAAKKKFRKAGKINPARRGRLNALLKWCTEEDLKEAIKKVETDPKYDRPFYRGENDTKWVAKFDWFLEDKTITELLESEDVPQKPKYKF